MKYKTIDEWQNFSFAESYIGDIQVTNRFFYMELDNVIILPENSCNRDIRKMPTNGLVLKLKEFSIMSLVEEGYKMYDANENFMKEVKDVIIPEKDHFSVIKELVEGIIYSLEKKEDTYVFSIDAANEKTYTLEVKVSHDVVEWERFLSLTEG